MTFKFIHHEQGSEDWHRWRRFKVSASNVATVMGDNPYKTPLQLWEEITWNIKQEDNPAMQEGRDNEPIARAWANSVLASSYKPICVESIDHPHLIASLDGWDELFPYPILEIKSSAKIHEKAKRGVIDLIYQWQCQAQLLITGTNEMMFCSHHKGDGCLIKVRTESSMQDRIETETKPFYDRLLNFDPPSPCDRDIQTVTNTQLLADMDEYTVLENALKSNQERMKALKDRITQGLDKCGIKRANVGSKRVSLIPMKGRVDYDIIPQLQGLDLNQFRAAPTTQWRIMNYSSSD